MFCRLICITSHLECLGCQNDSSINMIMQNRPSSSFFKPGILFHTYRNIYSFYTKTVEIHPICIISNLTFSKNLSLVYKVGTLKCLTIQLSNTNRKSLFARSPIYCRIFAKNPLKKLPNGDS